MQSQIIPCYYTPSNTFHYHLILNTTIPNRSPSHPQTIPQPSHTILNHSKVNTNISHIYFYIYFHKCLHSCLNTCSITYLHTFLHTCSRHLSTHVYTHLYTHALIHIYTHLHTCLHTFFTHKFKHMFSRLHSYHTYHSRPYHLIVSHIVTKQFLKSDYTTTPCHHINQYYYISNWYTRTIPTIQITSHTIRI